MAVDTHGRWPWLAAALVGPTWGAALARREALRTDNAWVALLGLPILLAHQTEEWVRPGGFLPFCNERLLGSDRPTWPLTERDGFHVNVTAGWGTAIAAALLWRRALRRSGRLGRGKGRIAAALGIGLSAGLPLAMKLRMHRARGRSGPTLSSAVGR